MPTQPFPSEKSSPSPILKNLTQVGFVLGLLFPLFSILIDLSYQEYTFSIPNLLLLYQKNPLHWIILSAPLVLGYTCYLLGNKIKARESFLEAKSSREKNQADLIEAYITQLAEADLTAHIPADFENESLAAKLKSFQEILQRDKHEASQRRWTNEGLAEFGDLLRKHTNLSELSAAVVSKLVKYLKCSQAGLFTAEKEGEDIVLVLNGCYAYERKKFLTKKIDPGTGLLGQCFLEKRTILLYDVPADYVSITSGLGDAAPHCLILCPLKTDDNVEGVIELAGFRKFDVHEIQFLEKVCENTAAVFKNLKTAESTHKLLEDAQAQAEMFRSQEEEMRQNMEELSATQEEMTRKEKEFSSMLRNYKEKFGELNDAATA